MIYFFPLTLDSVGLVFIKNGFVNFSSRATDIHTYFDRHNEAKFRKFNQDGFSVKTVPDSSKQLFSICEQEISEEGIY